MVNKVICPICESRELVEKLKVMDYFFTQEEFIIEECLTCGFAFTNPKPAPIDLEKYYQSDEYISHNASVKSIFGFVYRSIRKNGFRSKLKLIKKYSKTGSLLDIGCGTGEFLNHLRRSGFNVMGIEPNIAAREFALEQYQLAIFDEHKLLELKNDSFDIITMWHVLEHVYDLDERLQTVKKLLKPSGTLIIALPNPNSFDAKYYKQFWAAWDVPRHLHHFTQKSLDHFLGKHDFEISAIKPMIFDSFYISLLSQKYKTKSQNYFQSFIIGLKSNLKAKHIDYGFSSQIYIAKRKHH